MKQQFIKTNQDTPKRVYKEIKSTEHFYKKQKEYFYQNIMTLHTYRIF